MSRLLVGGARRSRGVFAVAISAFVLMAAAVVCAPTAQADSGCPKLYVLGVQGTGQSSSDASPTLDAGMLSSVMKPMMTMVGSVVQRAYVPYPAGFGGATAGSKVEFDKSVTQAVARTKSMISQIASRCSETKFALTGYSQGAMGLGMLARDIGQGKGPVPADRVAAVSLFGDPTRPEGSSPFPGATGATRPSVAPGTSGSTLTQLPAVDTSNNPSGGGIAPQRDTQSDYGDLTGRVLSNCAAGDLACDAPSNAPVTHLVTNIVGQSKLDQDDPVQTLGSLAEALALTTVKTAVPVINEDVQGETVEDLSYQPNTSLSQRLATASDPRTPLPTMDEALSAVMKVGTIGLNAAVTVAQKVFTPATITALATTGLANPPAALAMLAGKALEATVELVPPSTANRWADEAFSAVEQNVSDNSELLDVSNVVRYWQTAQQHGSYTQASQRTAGLSATLYTAMWFAAIAADLAGKTFHPLVKGGVITADPTLPPSAAVVPTLPDTTSASAPSTTATTTGSPSVDEPSPPSTTETESSPSAPSLADSAATTTADQ